jgi:hypothetical protein
MSQPALADNRSKLKDFIAVRDLQLFVPVSVYFALGDYRLR